MKNKNRNPFLLSVIKETVKKNRGISFLLFLSVALSVFLSLIPPLVLAFIINRMVEGKTDLLPYALLYFALLALAGFSESGKEVIVTVFGQKITHGIRSRMLFKLSRLPAGYFTVNTPGQIVSRFVSDVDTLEDLFTDGIIGMFTDILNVAGIIIMIWIQSKGLGILISVAVPLLFLMTRSFQKKMLRAQTSARVAVSEVNSHIPETIRNIRMIHSFGKEHFMEQRYDESIRRQYRATEKSNLYDAVYSPIVIMISTAVVAVMMVMAAKGGSMLYLFGMNAGTAVAVIAYVGKVFGPLEDIGMEIQSIQSAVAGKKRIEEFLKEPERTEADLTVKTSVLKDQAVPVVEFSGVRFGYDPDIPVLENISFAVKRGEKVTFTGRTGIGKSTAFRLILGLYVPEKGTVKIFGTKASLIPDSEKRKLFGYAEQTFQAVDGTVAEQISLFDPSFDKNQIENAARLSGIHEKILTLEKGYDTPFREGLFSQGQIQLLSIARAIVADPPVLLLDEMTANLDSGTEAQVMDALLRVSGNRTVLSISHRYAEISGGRTVEFL